MKIVLLVVLLAAAATAAEASNEVPDVVELSDVADMDVNEMPEVVVTKENELADVDEKLVKPAGVTPRQQSWGTVDPSDKLLYNEMHTALPVANGQHRDVRINAGSRISAIRVNPASTSPAVRFSIRSGGIGSNHVTFIVQTAANRGYNVRIAILGP